MDHISEKNIVYTRIRTADLLLRNPSVLLTRPYKMQMMAKFFLDIEEMFFLFHSSKNVVGVPPFLFLKKIPVN